jgi:hypothetical protein
MSVLQQLDADNADLRQAAASDVIGTVIGTDAAVATHGMDLLSQNTRLRTLLLAAWSHEEVQILQATLDKLRKQIEELSEENKQLLIENSCLRRKKQNKL